jgi:hypothetical protein
MEGGTAAPTPEASGAQRREGGRRRRLGGFAAANLRPVDAFARKFSVSPRKQLLPSSHTRVGNRRPTVETKAIDLAGILGRHVIAVTMR